MLSISTQSFSALSETSTAKFVTKCLAFLANAGLAGAITPHQADALIRARLPDYDGARLRSERAAALLICLEVKAGRPPLADPEIANGLGRLPADEAVRLEWLLAHLQSRSDWAPALSQP